MYYPQQHPDDPRSNESAPPPYDPNLPPVDSNAYGQNGYPPQGGYQRPPGYPPYGTYQQPGYYPPPGANPYGGYPPPHGYQQPPNYGYGGPAYGQPGYGSAQQQVYALPQYGPQAYPPPYGQPYPGYFPAMGYLPALWMPKASFGRRLAARLIDGVIQTVGIMALVFVTVLAAFINPFAAILSGIFILIFAMGYEIYYIGKDGATPGKKAMGIKVVDGYGRIPGYGRSTGRYLVNIFLSSQVFYLGYLWMLFDSQSQTWHDKIAGTYVVVERR